MATKKKSSIDDFKDRFSSPVVARRIDPKTGKPISGRKQGKAKRKGGKK